MKKLSTLFLLLTTSICWGQRLPTRVQVLAGAIARAEGFYVRGSIPNRLRNPGDIRALKGQHYPGQVGLTKNGYVIFRTDRDGWAALFHQIEKIQAGDSKFYTVNMTLRQLSKKYATSSTWVKNVSKILGTKPEARLWEVLEVAPVLEIRPQSTLDKYRKLWEN